jgi:hypothetical protein
MFRRFLIIGAAIIVVAACTASSGVGGSDAGSPSVAAPAPDPSSQPAPSGDVSLPPEITDPIVADAAARLGVDPSAVKIVSAHAETFSDGSLGCPEPGMLYTQAIVDGYQVVVEANGAQLDYRGSGPAQFRLCENP